MCLYVCVSCVGWNVCQGKGKHAQMQGCSLSLSRDPVHTVPAVTCSVISRHLRISPAIPTSSNTPPPQDDSYYAVYSSVVKAAFEKFKPQVGLGVAVGIGIWDVDCVGNRP